MDSKPNRVKIERLEPCCINLVLGRTCTSHHNPHPCTKALSLFYSASGKTQLMYRVITNFEKLFSTKIAKLVLSCATQQRIYTEMINRLSPEIPVRVFEGITEEMFSPEVLKRKEGAEGCTVLIIDDALSHILGGKFERHFIELATIHSHHDQISTWFLLQNTSFKKPEALSIIFQNARHIFTCFYNSKIATNLARQIQVSKASLIWGGGVPPKLPKNAGGKNRLKMAILAKIKRFSQTLIFFW